MPLYRNKDRILLFVHIPKTGGSAVENFLQSSSAVQALHSRQRLGLKSVTPQHMHWEVIEKWIPKNFYDADFCVVRNPLSRICSEYRWQSQVRKAAVKDFNTWINNQLNLFEQNPYVCDNHIRPQLDFVGNGVEVFRLEDGLAHATAYAISSLRILANTVDIPKVAATERQLLKVTSKTIRRLQEFYKGDFEKFGYDQEKIPNGLFEISDS